MIYNIESTHIAWRIIERPWYGLPLQSSRTLMYCIPSLIYCVSQDIHSIGGVGLTHMLFSILSQVMFLNLKSFTILWIPLAHVPEKTNPFSRFLIQDLISYNACISACEKAGQWVQALKLLHQLTGQKPQGDVIMSPGCKWSMMCPKVNILNDV